MSVSYTHLSLAFYPNTMDPDLEKREAAISHLKAVIRASAKLGVNMVTTFIGKDQHKTFEENIELFRQIWPDIIALAEQCGVKVAIENCPMPVSYTHLETEVLHRKSPESRILQKKLGNPFRSQAVDLCNMLFL